jgi:hypothetical protein
MSAARQADDAYYEEEGQKLLDLVNLGDVGRPER